MPKTRILVVEDSPTVRNYLVDILNADPELEVVGEAADGKAALELCRLLRPDIITLDMMLPVMTGVAVTEYIMAYFPTPILIVSASTNRGELYKTYDALAAGAVDVLEKSRGDDAHDGWSQQFIAAVKMVSRIKVITHIRGKLGGGIVPALSAPTKPRAADVHQRVIAIGGSTGAPGAIVEILRALPEGFPIPILLVIHIGHPFGVAFAEWLDGYSTMAVRTARDGEPMPELGRAEVIMAPPDRHLVVQRGRLRLTADTERHSCRPSVDVLFESVAREYGEQSAGCLLTGMGKDGALGLLALRQAGAFTLAQDESSSVVFGMPKEAIAIGGAECVAPLHDIAPTLLGLAKGVLPRRRS